MVNYKKIVLVTLLSCIAFSFQVQALSRCLALPKPIPKPTSQAMHGTVSPCVYNADETTLRIAQEMFQCLKEKINNITPLVALAIDYLEPVIEKEVITTKDQLIGSSLQACCQRSPYMNSILNKARILKEPAIAEPLEGLYGTIFGSHDPMVSVRLRFSNTKNLSRERITWLYPLTLVHNISVIKIYMGCKECGRIKMEPCYLQKGGQGEIFARKRIGYPLCVEITPLLHDLEITGWNEQAGAGTGIAMRIYKDTPDVRLWVALMKLREDERANKAKSVVVSQSSSSSSTNPSCSSSESAERAANLKDL